MLHRRDAVLPFVARRAGHQIDGSGLQFDRLAVPFRPVLAPQPEAAGRKQRDPGDKLKLRLVAMPAYTGARPIFVDQQLCERLGRLAGKEGDLITQRQQEIRYRRCLHHLATIIIIAQAKTGNLPVGEMAMEVEGLELQALELT